MCMEYSHLFLLSSGFQTLFSALQGLSVPVLSKASSISKVLGVPLSAVCSLHPPAFHSINKTKQKHLNCDEFCPVTAFLHNWLIFLKELLLWSRVPVWNWVMSMRRTGFQSLPVMSHATWPRYFQASHFPDLQSDLSSSSVLEPWNSQMILNTC